MTIRKKVEIEFPQDEKKKLNFIAKGGEVKADKQQKQYTEVLLRIPNFLLEEINKEIEKKPWTTRTQWILDAISKRLEDKVDEK